MSITEDYVSYEVAKLLKEKGFNCPCRVVYSPKGIIKHYLKEEVYGHNLKGHKKLCPTLQMAMKWLREVHHLYIDVGFGNDDKGEFLYMGDIYDLTNDAIHGIYKPIIEADDYLFYNPKNYEEACEAALKYSLEHLI